MESSYKLNQETYPSLDDETSLYFRNQFRTAASNAAIAAQAAAASI
jgi:hypothetical protein